MNKVIEVFAKVVIALFLLAIFGWMVSQRVTKKKSFGFLDGAIEFMYSFPDLFEQSVEEVKTLPRTFIKTYNQFSSVNKLKKDLIVLTTYTSAKNFREIALINLRNDSILRTWAVDSPYDETTRIINPIYLEDGSLIYNFYYRADPGLIKLNPEGEMVWSNDSLVVHHGMNLNADGDIWACTKAKSRASGLYSIGGKDIFYNDYRITKYDGDSGNILFDKSVTQILEENDLSNYLLKTSNVKDPIHLNDVQPALKTTTYFNEDDVFISLRSMSIVLHYRPATNELIELIEGPFINQHDVDIINDSTLTIFNNNTFVDINRKGVDPKSDTASFVYAGDFYSNIIQYDLATKNISFVADSTFRANQIFTKNEGLSEFLGDNTFFVEEQNPGLLWVIRNDSVIYKNVLKSQHEGHHHLPNWTRVVRYK